MAEVPFLFARSWTLLEDHYQARIFFIHEANRLEVGSNQSGLDCVTMRRPRALKLDAADMPTVRCVANEASCGNDATLLVDTDDLLVDSDQFRKVIARSLVAHRDRILIVDRMNNCVKQTKPGFDGGTSTLKQFDPDSECVSGICALGETNLFVVLNCMLLRCFDPGLSSIRYSVRFAAYSSVMRCRPAFVFSLTQRRITIALEDSESIVEFRATADCRSSRLRENFDS